MTNKLAYVNCGNHASDQNCLAEQFKGRIYYLTTRSIGRGEEYKVSYGKDFEKDMGIDHHGDYQREPCREDWREEGAACGHCHTWFATQQNVDEHIANASRGGPRVGCPILKKERNEKKKADGLAP